MKILAKVQFGSLLYGTNVEGSDTDYRSIYLPDIKDCLLNNIKDAWEDKSEEDTSIFSLHHFLKLASEGQSIAIELLCAPRDKVITTSPTWQKLQENRKMFFTKNMKSFLGYAKTMSGKYSARIDRLNETEAIFKVLNQWDDRDRLLDIWNELPESLNAVKSVNDRNKNRDKRCYIVCGRELQISVTVGHAKDVVGRIHSSYGERVRKSKNGQIEWKALGHAFRAAMQVEEIALTGDLKFPLKDADWLRELRLGNINFLENELDKKLDDLIAETQILINKSDLPDKVDKNWVDNFILECYEYKL